MEYSKHRANIVADRVGDTINDNPVPLRYILENATKKKVVGILSAVRSAFARHKYDRDIGRATCRSERVIRCPSSPAEFIKCTCTADDNLTPGILEYIAYSHHEVKLFAQSHYEWWTKRVLDCIGMFMVELETIWDEAELAEVWKEAYRECPSTTGWKEYAIRALHRPEFSYYAHQHYRTTYPDIAKEYKRFIVAHPEATLEKQFTELYAIIVKWCRDHSS